MWHLSKKKQNKKPTQKHEDYDYMSVRVCVYHVFQEWPLGLLSMCRKAAMFVGVWVY